MATLLSKIKKIFAISDYMEYTTKEAPFVVTAEVYDKWNCIDFEEDLHQELLSIPKDERFEYLYRFKKEVQSLLDGYARQKESVYRLYDEEYLRCLLIYKEQGGLDNILNINKDLDIFIYRTDYLNYKLHLHEDRGGMKQLFGILDILKLDISAQFDTNPDFELLNGEDAERDPTPIQPPDAQNDILKPFLKLTKEDRNNGDNPGTEFYTKVFPVVKNIRIEDEKHLYAMASILHECKTYFKDNKIPFSKWALIIAHKLDFQLKGKGYNKGRLKDSVAELKNKHLILDNLK